MVSGVRNGQKLCHRKKCEEKKPPCKAESQDICVKRQAQVSCSVENANYLKSLKLQLCYVLLRSIFELNLKSMICRLVWISRYVPRQRWWEKASWTAAEGIQNSSTQFCDSSKYEIKDNLRTPSSFNLCSIEKIRTNCLGFHFQC